MKINRFFGIAGLALVFSSSSLSAQYYYPVALSGGFNGDAIANGVGPAASSTTIPIDNGASTTENNAYLSKDYQPTAASPVLTFGLPITGQFWGAVTTTQGLTYQLAPYTGQNTLKLSATGDTGTLSFTTATAANNLYLLTTGGGGAGVLSAVVNFSDGTNQSFTNLAVADWYGGTGFAIQGIGRVKIDTDVVDAAGGTNPRMYQIPMAINAANQSKTITSVAITKTSGSGLLSVFAISADKYSSCVAPTAITASAIAATSATVSWTAPSTPPSSYDVYYTSATVAPSSTATPSVAGVTATTTPTGVLVSNTKYYVWVRSKCGATTGEWAYGTSFTTSCSPFAVPYSENFDTASVGSTTNTNAPNCWAYLETNAFAGYGYVSTGNTFSAPNNYYLYNGSGTTGNQMLVSPETIALSDGTKRVKFYAKGGAAGYTLQVGTLTNPTDPTTFVSFNTTTLTTSQSQYTVNIPSGGGNYLAFRHNLGGTARAIYLDDITVEAIPSCVEPIALTATGQAINSISLSWTNNATVPAANYDIYYSTTNIAPTTGTVLNATNSFSSTTTTATVSGLTTDTTYYFWVRARCSTTDQSIWVGPVSSFTGYCRPSSTNQNSWISGFTSTGASINMAYASPSAVTGTNGYQNLSLSSNTILSAPSAATPLTVTVGGGGSYGVAIWVDWDNSLTFSTAERVYATTGYITTPANTTLTIPAGQAVGNYRMRVMCDFNSTSPSNPCATPTRGEFLDFTLQVASQLATSEVGSDKKEIKISPNPFTDVINISEFKDIKTVKIIDLAGRTLQTIENPGSTINLSSLSSGLYLVNMYFKDGSQKSVKVIKK